jgi:hypothetical protein
LFRSPIEFENEPIGITLDIIIVKLLEQIPGARITSEDWFASRRIQEEGVIDKLRAAGNPMYYADHILGSVDRAAQSAGPTKEIDLPMVGKGSMRGRISRDHTLLHTNREINQETVDRVLAVLRPLGLVKSFYVYNEPLPGKAGYDD